jgi:hypothetical protein
VNESVYAPGGKSTSSEVPRSTCRPVYRTTRRKCQTRALFSRVESARFEETGLELAVVHYFGWLTLVRACAYIPHACTSVPIMRLAASLISLFLNLLVIRKLRVNTGNEIQL